MHEYCSALVRIYSKYTEQIPAPLGFDTPSRSLETSKWQHFPMNGNLMFSIVKEYDNSYILQILWNELILEFVRVSLMSSDKVIQFTARSPIISCKYVVRENSKVFIRRFQMVLHNDVDFSRVCATLSDLRFVLRSARADIPQVSQVPQTLQTLGGQTDHIFRNKKSPNHMLAETVPEKIRPTSHKEKVPNEKNYGPHPNYQSNWEGQVCNIGYPLNTQTALDDFLPQNSIQTQLGVPFEDDVSRSETGLRSNLLISENQLHVETRFNQYSNIVQGAIVAAPENPPVAIKENIALRNNMNENCARPIEENLALRNNMDENYARPVESNINPLQEIPNGIPLLECKNKVDVLDKNRVNLKDSHLESGGKTQPNESIAKFKHKVDVLDKNKAKLKDSHIESVIKAQPNESIAKFKKRTSSQNIKISKKLIKQKLQDDKFMQWVTKVEAVLSKMAKSKG